MQYPIIVFAYNRANLLNETLNNLKKCNNFVLSKIYIFIDGPKNFDDREDVNNVINVCEKFKDENPSTIIIKNNNNIGLKKSIIKGISEIFKNNEAAIIIEDDLLVSKNFLDYMNEGLDFYNNNKNIISISGYTPLNGKNINVTFSKRTSSWGWATWKDRWEKINWNLDKEMYKYIHKKQYHIKSLDLGYDFPLLIEKHLNSLVDSWLVIFVFNQLINDKWTVHPSNTKVLNIGMNSSGTHFKDLKIKDNRNLSNESYVFIKDVNNKSLTKFRTSNYRLYGKKYLKIIYREMIYLIIKTFK